MPHGMNECHRDVSIAQHRGSHARAGCRRQPDERGPFLGRPASCTASIIRAQKAATSGSLGCRSMAPMLRRLRMRRRPLRGDRAPRFRVVRPLHALPAPQRHRGRGQCARGARQRSNRGRGGRAAVMGARGRASSLRGGQAP
jgi:hypothetical protein